MEQQDFEDRLKAAVSTITSQVTSQVLSALRDSTATRAHVTDTGFEAKTSDVGQEENAMARIAHEGSVNAANLKVLADVGAHLAFDRSTLSLYSNPLIAQVIQNGINHTEQLRTQALEFARDNQTIKHLGNLGVLTSQDDLVAYNAIRGTQRDESATARGIQRDESALAATVIGELRAITPIILERLRDTDAFRALLIQALSDIVKKPEPTAAK